MDYVIASPVVITAMSKFIVNEFDYILSDAHCVIELELKMFDVECNLNNAAETCHGSESGVMGVKEEYLKLVGRQVWGKL